MQHPESVDAARNEAGSFQLAGGSIKIKLPILGDQTMHIIYGDFPWISLSALLRLVKHDQNHAYLILVNCEGFP